MFFLITFRWKSLLANLTLKWFNSSVRTIMILKIITRFINIWTSFNLAFVFPLLLMRLLMDLKMSNSSKFSLAICNFTKIGTKCILMSLDLVSLKVVEKLESLLTSYEIANIGSIIYLYALLNK